MTRKDFIKKSTAAAATAGLAGCVTAVKGTNKLALLGGTPIMGDEFAKRNADMFRWPIVNDAMRKASDAVLRGCCMSGTDITKEFEAKFAEWNGTKYALACLNGTTALNTAFYAIGLKPGDEVICPSITMWASCSGVVNIGATVVFCDVRPDDLTIDPASFEAHITPRTKAVVVVHYMGAPCDMDPIMKIAKNTCLDFIKQKKRVEPLEYEIDGESVERPIPDTDVQSNPPEAVMQKERRQEVQNALLRLGEEHREILTLRYMNGLSYEQLQEVLGVGMGTVKSRLARAKKSLQNILKSGNIF